MRTSFVKLSIALLAWFVLPITFGEEGAGSEEEKKPIPAWLGEDNRRRLVRLLKDFNQTHEDHDVDAVASTIRTLQSAKGTVEISAPMKDELMRWLKAYRQAKGFHEEDTMFLLVELGCIQEIERAVGSLRPRTWRDGLGAPERLLRSKQRLVIPSAARELFAADGLRPIRITGEFVFDPPTFVAADIINSILIASPAFNNDVRKWARELRRLKKHKRVDLLRLWWKENKQFFDTMSYDRVAPLSPDKYTLKPEDYKPKRRPIRKVK